MLLFLMKCLFHIIWKYESSNSAIFRTAQNERSAVANSSKTELNASGNTLQLGTDMGINSLICTII